MYVCKMMRLSLPHVLILYIYYMYNVYLSLCVITLYCKCVSANKILLYYILYIIKNYDVFYPLIIPPRVLYWTICLKPVITVYNDNTCCEVIYKRRYNNNDIMTTNKLPGMYFFLITVIFPIQNQYKSYLIKKCMHFFSFFFYNLTNKNK
jgi:hypothetical protein